MSLLDLRVTSAPVPTTSFNLDSDDILLASLLNRLSSRSTLHDSVSSEYAFYSVPNDPASPTPVLHQTPVPDRCFHRKGLFVAGIPHPSIGDPSGGCAFRCTTYWESDFAHPSGEFGLPLHHPRFLKWVVAPESLAGSWSRNMDPVVVPCTIR